VPAEEEAAADDASVPSSRSDAASEAGPSPTPPADCHSGIGGKGGSAAAATRLLSRGGSPTRWRHAASAAIHCGSSGGQTWHGTPLSRATVASSRPASEDGRGALAWRHSKTVPSAVSTAELRQPHAAATTCAWAKARSRTGPGRSGKGSRLSEADEGGPPPLLLLASKRGSRRMPLALAVHATRAGGGGGGGRTTGPRSPRLLTPDAWRAAAGNAPPPPPPPPPCCAAGGMPHAPPRPHA